MQSKKILTVFVLFSSLGLLGGCGHLAQMEEVRVAAEAAMEKANSAYDLAQTAHSMASEASYAADVAQDTADTALRCCNANSSKMDRMYEKIMRK